ncbi:unnamed protein product [Fraxinus pennsylvanica]|uniref:Uncharacterized protein n=1 Tax=Fraxinus pennsylvanica TaxID=56036 RepID=A0AAD2ECR2_9LAMI|nr:unnamed protein product [Fraxinus pennsylvanica]
MTKPGIGLTGVAQFAIYGPPQKEGCDQSGERCGSYSSSADISESEFSSGGLSCRLYKVDEENGSALSSIDSSPISAVAKIENYSADCAASYVPYVWPEGCGSMGWEKKRRGLGRRY